MSSNTERRQIWSFTIRHISIVLNIWKIPSCKRQQLSAADTHRSSSTRPSWWSLIYTWRTRCTCQAFLHICMLRKLCYFIQTLPIQSEIVWQINTTASYFTWRGVKFRVTLATLCLAKTEFGADLTYTADKFQACPHSLPTTTGDQRHSYSWQAQQMATALTSENTHTHTHTHTHIYIYI